MNERANEWMNEWMYVRLCEWVCEWMTGCWCKWLNELSVGCINQLGVYLKANKSTVKTDSKCNCMCISLSMASAASCPRRGEWVSRRRTHSGRLRIGLCVWVWAAALLWSDCVWAAACCPLSAARRRWRVRFSCALVASWFSVRPPPTLQLMADCVRDGLEPNLLTITNSIHMFNNWER